MSKLNDLINRYVNSFCILALILLCSCTDVKSAEHAIKKEGLVPVTVGGYDPFKCDPNDSYATKFIAKNKNGQTVTGTVCGGILFHANNVILNDE